MHIIDRVLKDPDLTHATKTVFSYVYRHRTTGVTVVAREIGSNPLTIYRALRTLKAKGYLSYERVAQAYIFSFPEDGCTFPSSEGATITPPKRTTAGRPKSVGAQ